MCFSSRGQAAAQRSRGAWQRYPQPWAGRSWSPGAGFSMRPSPPTRTNSSASGKEGCCEEGPCVRCVGCLSMPRSLCLQDPGEADLQGEGQGKAGPGESGETLPAAWQGVGRAVHRSRAQPGQAQVGGTLLFGQGKWLSCGCPQPLPLVPLFLSEYLTCLAVVSMAEKSLKTSYAMCTSLMVPTSLPKQVLVFCFLWGKRGCLDLVVICECASVTLLVCSRDVQAEVQAKELLLQQAVNHQAKLEADTQLLQGKEASLHGRLNLMMRVSKTALDEMSSL